MFQILSDQQVVTSAPLQFPCASSPSNRQQVWRKKAILWRVLIFGEPHLRRVLTAYSYYYSETRTHLGLGKDAPNGRAVQRLGFMSQSPSSRAYIIATHGHDFREGQAVSIHASPAKWRGAI
jgi:hypothetical protein